MPVAGENAIVSGPAMQRKTHMGAAVIHCVNLILVIKHSHWPIAPCNHDGALLLDLINRPNADTLCGVIHDASSWRLNLDLMCKREVLGREFYHETLQQPRR